MCRIRTPTLTPKPKGRWYDGKFYPAQPQGYWLDGTFYPKYPKRKKAAVAETKP